MLATNHSYKIRSCSKEDANKYISMNIKKKGLSPQTTVKLSQNTCKSLKVDTLFYSQGWPSVIADYTEQEIEESNTLT